MMNVPSPLADELGQAARHVCLADGALDVVKNPIVTHFGDEFKA